MHKFITYVLIGVFTLCYTAPAMADSTAEEASQKGLHAVTVFIDITRFNRKNGAAKKLTQSHQEFARFGYRLVAVNVYTENSDLEGFFVSYRKDFTADKP